MGIVSAGMHHAIGLGCELNARKLLQGEGVHIGPKCYDMSRCPSFEESHHAGASDPGLYLHTDASQLFGDEGGSPALLEGEFRIRMDSASETDHVVLNLTCFV
jgi:hypothetical protein